MSGMLRFHLVWGFLVALSLTGMGCQAYQPRERGGSPLVAQREYDRLLVAQREYDRLSHQPNTTWYRTPHDNATVNELELVSADGTIAAPPAASVQLAGGIIPLQAHRIEPMNILLLQMEPAPMLVPIASSGYVEQDPRVNRGANLGLIQVAGMTLEQDRNSVPAYLIDAIKDPSAANTSGQPHNMQPIRLNPVTRQEGSLGLGTYGNTYIAVLPGTWRAIQR
jgi:hypothetical protein